MMEDDMVITPPPHIPNKPRAILVEDEPAVRRSLQLLLHAQGLAVKSYANALDVLADPEADESLCMIADYRLSDLNGIELTRRLKARGWQGRTILITAFATSDLAVEAKEAGIAAILEKPFRERQLVELLRGCVPDEFTQ